MDMRGIKFTKVEDITGGGKILCTGIRADREYVDGKASDKIIGTRYEVVFPARGFAKATIKTPELKPAVTEDDLFIHDGAVEIELVNFSATVYRDSRTGQPALSLRAHAVRMVQPQEPLA